MSTSHTSFQTGRAAACYVTIAYTDGCIQCLLRDSLQQIGCVDIPKSGNPQSNLFQDAHQHTGPTAAKIPRIPSTVAICDTAFTANGNVLVAVDSLGQLYLYRMSPISDPGGPHVPDSVASMLTKCLLSGYDWWDISVCCASVSLAGTKCIQGQLSGSASSSPIDIICEKLSDDFHRQPTATQSYYFNRFMSIKTSIYRLMSIGSGGASGSGNVSEYKAADCFIHSMLTSIYGAFKSLLRPVAIDINSNDTAFDKVSKLLAGKMKDETDLQKLAKLLSTREEEFNVEPHVLQSFHQLIQWVSDLCLNLCASIPELKGKTGQNSSAIGLCGPGASLLSNINVLTMLRELLLLIRLWGKNVPAIRPVYTKTSADDAFDLLPKLFEMLTKLIAHPNNLEDKLFDDAVLLPSHVMIPPLHYLSTAARGIAPALTSGQGKCPISYEFGCEPQQDAFSLENSCGGGGYVGLGVSPLIWSSTSGAVDCVKNMYLGKCPFSVKRCTR